MGVTNLWSLVAASSRPTPLPTLNHRRLAIDASIWIYQFLKAVRDKEGNALRNAHVVGFFRRICKLLFHGIRPVFVFDGGAPALKRATIAGRKRRREGRREVGRQVAARLLGIQLLRRAEEEKERQRERARGPAVEGERQDGEEEIQETDLVYVEELGMDKAERERKRGFKKKDAYHLPDLKSGGLSAMGQPDDPRIMSQEELEEYARQFESGEDINLYDFSKIDFDSPFFVSLPAADRYNILNAARLRSRLRMGYSKEQLEEMFPDRMAFSRFQIERVTERNELTQRLMNLNGMDGGDGGLAANGVGRVAGERGREYVLVKNDGVDGGWALGVVTKKDEGARSKPIDVDEEKAQSEDEVEEDGDEIGAFEDVPIEGLNRLPKITGRVEIPGLDADERRRVLEQRRALYESRKETLKPGKRRPKVSKYQDPDSLFITEDLAESEVDSIDEGADDLFEDVEATQVNDSDTDLDRAIAMSLQQETNDTEDEYRRLTIEEIRQTKADETMPFKKGSGRMIAHIANNRANAAALKAAQQKAEASETLYIQSASERAPLGRSHILETPKIFNLTSQKEVEKTAQTKGAFGGPLPFEKLDFSKSLLGAKKKKGDADEAGGFERTTDGDTTAKKKEQPQEAPPWFDSDAARDTKTQEDLERRQREDDKLKAEQEAEKGRLKALKDVEARRVLHRHTTNDVVEVDASDDGHDSDVQMIDVDDLVGKADAPMDDMAGLVKAKPTAISEVIRMEIEGPPQFQQHEEQVIEPEESIEWEDSEVDERFLRKKPKATVKSPTADEEKIPTMPNEPESTSKSSEAIQDRGLKSTSRSASPTFEDVIPERALSPMLVIEPGEAEKSTTVPTPPASASASQAILPIVDPFDDAPALEYDDESDYSDPEDATLLASLTAEATEHARFAASLNPTVAKQTASSYESDLRALRTQQAATRRDADEVSHIMVTECQQLLSLFGLPYITAPMEAEAQCAELVRLGLVDGIVTDDSDCFLFGGTRIYKNMFNQAKFVECYLAADLEREFDLSREKLIRIAHLLGSDYTEGIPGVGPVTALEIVGEFEQLEDFREWLQGVQEGTRLTEGDRGSAWRKKFRRKAAGMFLPPGFPSEAVTKAYLQPEVDSSPVPFQWGVPDLDELRGFLMRTIGWTQERTDEILVPVIKDMNRRVVEGTQSNITGFFGGTVGVGARAARAKDGRNEKRGGKAGSRRMEGALGRLREGAKRKRIETRGIVESTNANDTQQEEVLVAEVAAKVSKKAKRVTQAKVKTTRRPAFASDSDSSDERRVLED